MPEDPRSMDKDANHSQGSQETFLGKPDTDPRPPESPPEVGKSSKSPGKHPQSKTQQLRIQMKDVHVGALSQM